MENVNKSVIFETVYEFWKIIQYAPFLPLCSRMKDCHVQVTIYLLSYVCLVKN